MIRQEEMTLKRRFGLDIRKSLFSQSGQALEQAAQGMVGVSDPGGVQ